MLEKTFMVSKSYGCTQIKMILFCTIESIKTALLFSVHLHIVWVLCAYGNWHYCTTVMTVMLFIIE